MYHKDDDNDGDDERDGDVLLKPFLSFNVCMNNE